MHVCLFDIDGTLINTGGAGSAAIAQAFGQMADVDGLDGVHTVGRTDRGIAADLFSVHGVEPSADNWQRFRAAYLEHLRANLEQREGRVLAGVVELLEHLACRDDVAVGLLTGNVAEGARIKLEYYNLMQHFAFGGFGDEHPDRDDVAREALRVAQTHLNRPISGENVCVIGDTPHDIRCARAIGAKALAVSSGFCSAQELNTAEPDLLVESLADPAVLRVIYG
jgi:phosphoglycolate phosphatase-like HAD superfamily hydrolase